MCARALRTPEWTYCVYDPSVDGNEVSHSTKYVECALYSIPGDLAQITNLIGRPQHKDVTAKLREEMKHRIVSAGEPPAEIEPAKLFI